MALSSSKIGTARVLYFLNAAGMFHETARDLVILYSVAKNSSVMLHLERKAFYPATPPFPILHVASGWDTA